MEWACVLVQLLPTPGVHFIDEGVAKQGLRVHVGSAMVFAFNATAQPFVLCQDASCGNWSVDPAICGLGSLGRWVRDDGGRYFDGLHA